ncbi:MAG TPA: FAD-dependent oxidoreductase, partial [Polyangiaceae bacterium]|nr:FAD-dependent oxidoreductase [Polyangiaceae bacterium]
MNIAVIGAGLSGLVVARACAARGDSIRVFEAEPRAGGQLHTLREHGFVVEYGAEGFVAGSAVVPALAADLGISELLQEQRLNLSYGFDGSTLTELGPGEAARFLGFQVKSEELGRGVRTFAGGMQTLSDALVQRLPANVSLELGRRTTSLRAGGRELVLGFDNGPEIRCDAVVVATSAAHASALLAAEFAAPARALSDSETLSSASVSLAFRQKDVAHPLEASGFVIAVDAQREGLRAGSISSRKFEGRAPAGHVLV